METAILPNGLRIILRHTASPVVYCGYCVAGGTRNEQKDEYGIAHLCEHLTFKGTHERDSMRILCELEEVGGELNAFTTKQDTVYYSAILKEHTERAACLLTDIVFHSVYPEEEILKEREVVCDEIESYNDNPSELIFDEFESRLFTDHDLGHNILGEADQVRTYCHDNAVAFTKRYYRPENSVFFVDGDIEMDYIVSLISRLTSDFPMAEPIINTKLTTDMMAAPIPYTPYNDIIHQPTHQAHVAVGNRGFGMHDDRRHALYLANNILAGPGMNSWLNLSLRERHGLVYTVYGSRMCYTDTGLWFVYFGCDPSDIDKCLQLVRSDLDRLIDEPLDEAALAAAKRQIKGQIAVGYDHRENYAIGMGRHFLHTNECHSIEELFIQVDGITALELQKMASEVFSAATMSQLTIMS